MRRIFFPSMVSRPSQEGFTLLEVLIAMGIFAVGFVAVAAIFPTAVLLQKKTVDDVVAQQVARNAQALLEARKITIGTGSGDGHLWEQLDAAAGGTSTWYKDQRIHPVPISMLTAGETFGGSVTDPSSQWFLSDRSYPSSTNPADERKVFWVPFVRYPKSDEDPQANPTDVIVYVFILMRAVDADYPRYGLNAPDWANYLDGFRDMPYPGTPAILGPDMGDVWNVPGIMRVSVKAEETNDPSNPGTRFFKFESINNQHPAASNRFRLNVGDKILDCYGGIYTVKETNINGVVVDREINRNLGDGKLPDEIWFAHSDSRGILRSTPRILTLSKAVQP